jgi:hypothetical protein
MSVAAASVRRMEIDWTKQLADQLDWHWRQQARPRLDGLTDDEYSWEPVPGCWSIRPRGEAVTAMAGGTGDYIADFAYPEPEPAPVTTIAWRLAHVIVGVFGMRNAGHFGGPAADYMSFAYAGTADGALAQLDEAYTGWIAGVRALGEDGLAEKSGPAEGPWAEHSMAELVLHINREAIHHMAEIALLRDLYRARKG